VIVTPGTPDGQAEQPAGDDIDPVVNDVVRVVQEIGDRP
jgi:hypothetical protein